MQARLQGARVGAMIASLCRSTSATSATSAASAINAAATGARAGLGLNFARTQNLNKVGSCHGTALARLSGRASLGLWKVESRGASFATMAPKGVKTGESVSRLGRFAALSVLVGGGAALALLNDRGLLGQESGCQLSKSNSKAPVMTSELSYFSGKTLSNTTDCKIFCGSGNLALGQSVAKYLGTELGALKVSRFADGEVNVQVGENVRGKHVVIIQSCTPPNVNDTFMELLLMVSAMRRSSAKTITVVMPYCPYMRSYEKKQPRTPIASKDTMTMLESMGVDRLVVLDMHAGQMQGFLSPSVPSDNITATKIGAIYVAENVCRWSYGINKPVADSAVMSNVVVVAPNAGAVPRAKEFWNVLLQRGMDQSRFAMVLRKPALGERDRKLATPDQTSVADDAITDEYEVVGDDNVDGSVAIIVNDILDSAESLCRSAAALKKSGAEKVYAFATHAILSPGALERISKSEVDRILVTNTVPIHENEAGSEKLEYLSVAPLLAETIRRICDKESLNPLFKLPKRPTQP